MQIHFSLPPSEPSERHQLHSVMDIVQSASAGELRAAVLALCKDTSVMVRLAGHIKKIRAAEANAPKTGEKRKASDQFFICVRCGETFSEQANHSKACTYHHGKCASGQARPGHRLNLMLTNTIQGNWS